MYKFVIYLIFKLYIFLGNLQGRLSKSLKSSVSTRWNSVVIMIESIIDVFNEIETILAEKGESKKLDISLNVLIQIKKFLDPFLQASLRLEKTSEPTIHTVSFAYTLFTNIDIQ